ncbi:hypothetical protein DBP15_28540 [Streptomyces sp. CS065A]|nr:hypothetical protein DBP15_28540 [Streptomyces sp. CS065A]
MRQPAYTICRRPGCTLPRGYRRVAGDRIRRNSHCTQACVAWERRARRALETGDGDEAVELLRLAALLDARTHPGEAVPDVFLNGGRTAA